MKKKILTLSCLLILAGCNETVWLNNGNELGNIQRAENGPRDAGFVRIAQDYLAGHLAWRPQSGTGLGLHEYDGKVTDLSAGSIAAELARLKHFDALLAGMNTQQLGTRAFYDYRLLHNAIKRERFSFEQMHAYTRNPMTYAGVLDVNIYIKRNFAPLDDRVKSITAILNTAPQVYAAARANLEPSLPRPYIETAMDQAKGSADFLGKDLVEALKDFPDGPVKTAFTAANKRAIEESLAYVDYLKTEKLPKANDNYALGRDNYRKLIAYGEMITLTPEEILAVGMRELKKNQDAFAETARLIDPSKKPIEVFEAVQKDHPTAENLLPDTRKHMEMIRDFLITGKIISLPSDVRVTVTETPQYARATSFASMDTPGPFETKATEAYYYVTPTESTWSAQQIEEWLGAFNYYTTDIVSIHEAYPGHYIQFLHMNASGATKVEKIFGSYAFVEGWAHYCEQMMVDQGFGIETPTNNPTPAEKLQLAKYRLAQIDEALLRICRLCVSIKMHTQGMTVAEGTKFFQDNCYYGEKPARSEAMRGTFDPEYLYYTLGKLEILKLREDYRKQEGEKFSLQSFHDSMLQHGMPPVRMLREMLLKDQAKWGEVF